MIVDTSASLFAVLPHGPVPHEAKTFRRLLRAIRHREELRVPAIMPYELAHVVFRKHGDLLLRRRRRLRHTFADLLAGITWESPSVRELAEVGTLARDHRMNLFDAAFVMEALRRRQPLLTADHGMAAHAHALGVRVFVWPEDHDAMNRLYPDPDA